jgi:hypothetical protein
MQVSILKPHIFQGRLLEGHAYYLHYLEVKPARNCFRSADHTIEAWLTKWTDITEITLQKPYLAMLTSLGRSRACLRMLLIRQLERMREFVVNSFFTIANQVLARIVCSR